MKNILVILTQANLTQLQAYESVSATMVLATFGSKVSVYFQENALSLLKNNLVFDKNIHRFKITSNLVDGFEFYDVEDLYVSETCKSNIFVQKTEHQLIFTHLNAHFLTQFDHILYW